MPLWIWRETPSEVAIPADSWPGAGGRTARRPPAWPPPGSRTRRICRTRQAPQRGAGAGQRVRAPSAHFSRFSAHDSRQSCLPGRAQGRHFRIHHPAAVDGDREPRPADLPHDLAGTPFLPAAATISAAVSGGQLTMALEASSPNSRGSCPTPRETRSSLAPISPPAPRQHSATATSRPHRSSRASSWPPISRPAPSGTPGGISRR